MLNVFTKFYKIEKKDEIMLNTFSLSLIIWKTAIKTWAQEMKGPGNELGSQSSTVPPPWKLYFNRTKNVVMRFMQSSLRRLFSNSVILEW